MKNSIKPCIWFDKEAEEASNFYKTVFKNSSVGRVSRYGKEGYEVHRMKEGTVLTMEITIEGHKFLFLNGGPAFKINPSLSFFILCDSAEEVDEYWEKLSKGATVRMPLDKYPWSDRYGWIEDIFGINWQIFYAKSGHKGKKISPALMFTGNNAGKAEEAISCYTSIFENSSIESVKKYEEGEGDVSGRVKHAEFYLGESKFIAFDSSYAHGFTFNEATSFIVYCDTQKEVDYFWNKLTEGGSESQCGWLKDKYGLSWQVVLSVLPELLNSPKGRNVMNALLKMKKLEIEKLMNA